MAHILQTSLFGDVLETAAAKVLEQMIAMADPCHKKVRRAVVVHVRKRGRHRNLIVQTDSSPAGQVFEPSAAEVSPQLVPTELCREINIEQTVSIDIGHRQPVPVVIVGRLIRPAGVIHNVVLEPDPALDNPIREMKSEEGPSLLRRRFLL